MGARLAAVGAFQAPRLLEPAAIVKSTLLRKTNERLVRFWLDTDEELAFGERGCVNEAPPDASEPHSVKYRRRSSGDCGGPHLRRQQCALRGT